MKLITLAKRYDFKTEHEYFNYLVDSHINGQLEQCKELFNAMTKEDKKKFLSYVMEDHIICNGEVTQFDFLLYDFYFNLF